MFRFTNPHFVPVLKVKPAEKRSLPQLDPIILPKITPLFEIVERKDKPGKPGSKPAPAKHLATAFKGFAEAVENLDRYFLDCREIDQDGPPVISDAFAEAATIGVPFTPVTSISRSNDVAPALTHAKDGIAIRLSKEEFEQGLIPGGLPAFLKQHSLSPGDVDLIVDLGAINQMISTGVENLAAAFLSDVPNPESWRTYTLTACAFPSSMGVVEKNSQASVDRLELLYWRDHLYSQRKSLARLPTFSDCGVQHRDGVEGYDPRKMPSSAAIRFTEGDSWLLAKGESMKLKGGAQFQDIAAGLISATAVDPDHCAGCAGIHQAAADPTGLRSLQKWRELGTTHHITQTVELLAALPWP